MGIAQLTPSGPKAARRTDTCCPELTASRAPACARADRVRIPYRPRCHDLAGATYRTRLTAAPRSADCRLSLGRPCEVRCALASKRPRKCQYRPSNLTRCRCLSRDARRRVPPAGMLHTQCVGVMVHAGGLPIKHLVPYQPDALRVEGFAVEQAMLPVNSRAFDGHRLLHEYFAFPDRFRFSR